MIELSIENNVLRTTPDTSISIEKNSPVFNDNTGSYSFPFSVPEKGNNDILSFPNRLERASELPTQNFVLKEDGITILKGALDYDEPDENEIALLLTAGNTEFNTLMKDKDLSDLDLGSESWFTEFDKSDFNDKLSEWDARNKKDDVSDYVVKPFMMQDDSGDDIEINAHQTTDGERVLIPLSSVTISTSTSIKNYYCFQFSISWILEKIYSSAGYRIKENELADSAYNNVVLFSKVMKVWIRGMNVATGTYDDETGQQEYDLTLLFYPNSDTLEYADLMPEEDVLDFIDAVKNLLCLNIIIDESSKEVSILFKKNLFLSKNLVSDFNKKETTGRKPKGVDPQKGFKLAYSSQDDDNATEYDFDVTFSVADKDYLPVASENYEDIVLKVTSSEREYICQENNGSYSWSRIGRLKTYIEDDGENDYSLDFKVPYQISNEDLDIPYLSEEFSFSSDYFSELGSLTISWSRPVSYVDSVGYKILNADEMSLDESIEYDLNLSPNSLYEKLHRDWINFETYSEREVTFYMHLTLAEVMLFKWSKRYLISGTPVFLNKLSFDLPFDGELEVNAYVG